jgi:Ca2+-binding RTX toxin-like protein
MSTFTGTDGPDVILSDADLIYAGMGDDTVHATNNVAVSIFGGSGDDILLFEGAFVGQATLAGGSGDDLLGGGPASDFLSGGTGEDTLLGGGGDDVLAGGVGGDVLDGGRFGRTAASYANAEEAMRADLLDPASNTGAAAGDSYIAIEALIGSAFNDTLVSAGGEFTLEGGAGADQLIGRAAFNYAGYAGALAGVQADLLDPSGNTGDAAGDVYDGIQGLVGSEFDDVLAGDDGQNRIGGGGGNDTIHGRGDSDNLLGGAGADLIDGGDGFDSVWGEAGDDTLLGGVNPDELVGGEGEDSLSGDDAADNLLGGAGNDTLAGGADDDNLGGGPGADLIDGGPGSDTAVYTYQGHTSGVRADLAVPARNTGDAAGDVFSGIENLSGTIFDDVLKGDNHANMLTGLFGDDLLIGRGDSDSLSGSYGNDTLQGQGGHDTLDGGDGDDLLVGGAGGGDVFAFQVYFRSQPGGFFDLHGHDVIEDFEDGVDLLRLFGLFEPDEGGFQIDPIPFEDLVITQQGADTLITYVAGFDASILIRDQLAPNITPADFVA